MVKLSNVLVTGGAGFIGSHLVDALMERVEKVCVYDDLSSGSLLNLNHWLENPRFSFEHIDIRTHAIDLTRFDTVFHFAASPEVRKVISNPESVFKQNVEATFALLEAVRKAENVETFVFSSSSTVYGDATLIPTPEDYSPLEPISLYGASKLACEALIAGYSHSYGFKAAIYRLANIVGPRSSHGVTYDFVQKLKKNPQQLEILGDGTQTKSYLYIDDLISSIFLSLGKLKNGVNIFNVGSEDQVDVKTIAQIVVEEMGLKDTYMFFTGGVDGGRGWKGDVKNMLLDIR
ncbi:MAG: NAD-dependent epimerase/dehydratase family protein, partial [Candidatus Bathyarchaeia archaeon]